MFELSGCDTDRAISPRFFKACLPLTLVFVWQVRVKAVQKKLELDLAIDTDSENYDQDAADHLKITKQVASFK